MISRKLEVVKVSMCRRANKIDKKEQYIILMTKKKVDRYQLTLTSNGENQFQEKLFEAIDVVDERKYLVLCFSNYYLTQNKMYKKFMIQSYQILNTIQPSQYTFIIYQLLKTNNNFYFVFQGHSGKTLKDLLNKYGVLPQKRALLILKQLIQALKHIKRQGFFHLGLKPQRIYIQDDKIKMRHLAFSKFQPADEHFMTRAQFDTNIYRTKQSFRGIQSNEDVWELGVILREMVIGEVFHSAVYRFVNYEGKIDTGKGRVSMQLSNLLQRMLVFDVKDRMRWEQLLQVQISQDGVLIPKQQA